MGQHEVKLILMFEELAIHPSIQNRPLYPFTDDAAEKFFNRFFNMTFEFDGEFRTVYIYDAKENYPKHSYAIGWLFENDLEEVNEYQRQHGNLPPKIGEIQFDCGGGIERPRITVRKK